MRPMKKARLRFGLPTGIALALLALVAASISVAANPDLPESHDDKSSPANQFLTAYNSMSLADWLKEKGMRTEATDLYTEALNLFLRISADYPQWQPAVVLFRINYCRGALKNLQGGVRRPANKHVERTTENPQPCSAGALRPGELKIENRKSKIPSLSPMNFKLQQAALKERGRDYTGALARYLALLEEYPRETWALKGACRCCLRLGHMDKARVLTRQALALPSPDADMHLLAALVDCYDGRYQAAFTLLHQSLKQNGRCPEAHAALGVVLASGGQMKKAQEEMKRALSLNPKLDEAYYNLARLSLQQKPADRDRARVHYQNALRYGAVTDTELDALLAE